MRFDAGWALRLVETLAGWSFPCGVHALDGVSISGASGLADVSSHLYIVFHTAAGSCSREHKFRMSIVVRAFCCVSST